MSYLRDVPPSLLSAAAIVLMIPCLFLIPIGLPGSWLMLAILGVATWVGAVSGTVFAILVALAATAEVAEFFIVRHASDRYGASRRAFWGAIAGGLVGVLLGAPLPILGPLIGGLIGTFAGAATVTWWETRHVAATKRAAIGVLIGRVFAAATKTAIGVAILVVGAAALIW